MDSPKDDEWYKQHKNLITESRDNEKKYNNLIKNGVKCDSCQDLYLICDLKPIRTSENHTKFAEELKQEFEQYNLRVEIDNSAETLGNKIRKNSREKIPYTLVIGDKEMSSKNLAVRVRDQKQLLNLSRKDFINQITKNINERKLNLI